MLALNLQDAYIRAGFGEQDFHNATNVSAAGIAILLAAVATTLAIRRKHALLPLILMTSAVPTGQRVAILTLDFNFIRLLLLAYGARILIRGEARGFRTSRMDRLFVLWLGMRLLAYTTLHASSGAAVYQAGQIYDFAGLYFVCRTYLREGRAVHQAVRWWCWLAIPVAALFILEMNTARNLFSAMGGVPEFTSMRDGRLRCQGPYEHPILAGAYWATLVPVFVALTRSGRRATNLAGYLGSGSALIIVVACASSTPLIGLLAGCGLAACFSLRRHAPRALVLLAAGLVVIHFARERPVWQLIAKAGVVGGSTADYRFRLIDAFIRNWSEWFLMGTKGTAHWGYYLFDLTNQYVVEGVRGGVTVLVLFLAVLAGCLRAGWRATVRRGVSYPQRRISWHTASALGGMAVMFLGISITHSNQTTMVLMFLLAACQAAYGRRDSATDGHRQRCETSNGPQAALAPQLDHAPHGPGRAP